MEHVGKKSWCGEDIGRRFGDNTREGSANGWIKTGGDRNEKSDGIFGSPFRVCGVY